MKKRKLGQFKKFGDENVSAGLVMPRDRIYSPSLNKRRRKVLGALK